MSELIPSESEVAEATKEDAEELDRQLCSVSGKWAFGLYYVKATKAHRRLGFSSFDDYCEDRFSMPRITVDHWMVRVRVCLIAHGVSVADFVKMFHGGTFSEDLLSVRVSRALNNFDSQSIVKAWKMLHTSGAVNLPVPTQLEEIDRWGRRAGLIEPKRRVVQDDPEEEEPTWCESCGKVRPLPDSKFCSACWKDYRERDMQVQTVSAPSFKVEGDTVKQEIYTGITRAVEPVMRHNGRQVIQSLMTITTDDPEVRFVLCTVPAGMCLREGEPFTVAIIKCQIP